MSIFKCGIRINDTPNFNLVGGIMQGTCVASCRSAECGINEENTPQECRSVFVIQIIHF